MVDVVTPNYGFIKPDTSSLMRDFETYINGNWDKAMGAVAPPSITGALPQSGSYNLYDRVYRTNDKSIYILIVKDALWGWHWRPVHAPISPWISIDPLPIYANASWNNPAPSNLMVAYDNRGYMFWRGFLVRASNMPHNTTEGIFLTLPKGIYPSRSTNFPLNPVTAAVTGSGLGMVQFARFFLSGDDRAAGIPGDSSIRLFGGDGAGSQPNAAYFNFSYEVGASWYGA